VTAVPAWRQGLLRTAGQALVSADAPRKADVIVLAQDAEGAAILDAVDLVKDGFATRVALFSAPAHAAEQEFARRGVTLMTGTAFSEQLLHTLGVANVELIPAAVSGSKDEASLLPAWCAARGYHVIIFISAADHSRRLHRALARATAGRGLEVVIRPSRYSDFDPNAWWLSRGGTRTEIVEMQKLLLDYVLHPFS
jgi:hypothetical protein